MCLQCVTEAKRYGQPIPGFALYRAGKSAPGEWEQGQLGLVQMNDPTVVLTVEPIRDIYDGLTEEEAEKVEGDNDAFLDVGSQVEADICASGDVRGIHRLVEAARQVGYDPENSGTFGYWLTNHLAKHLETATCDEDVGAVNREEEPAS